MTKANLASQRLVFRKLDVPVTARLDAVFEGLGFRLGLLDLLHSFNPLHMNAAFHLRLGRSKICVEMSLRSLELAGFVDANGNLGRPVPSSQIIVPGKVWRNGDAIRWRMGKTVRLQEVSKSMLNQFVRLTDSESILQFAKKWGVLALSGNKVLRPGRERMREGIEPIAAWQYYSRRAQAVLQIAAALKQNKPGDLNDWSMIGILVPRGEFTEKHEALLSAAMLRPHFGMSFNIFVMDKSPQRNVERARGFIADEIGRWLDCWKKERTTGVSDFALRWNDLQQRWDLQIDYHGLLFAAIALQLALVVADADSLFTCSGCAVPYIRPRERKRPKSGWANYCDECSKKGVAKRRAVETYREKRALALRMHSSGVSVQEIAGQLNSDTTRVRRWLQKGDVRLQDR
jgi:hypothetical protein